MVLLIILICMIPLYFLLFGKSNSLEINAKDLVNTMRRIM